jgi:hypothetical protein
VTIKISNGWVHFGFDLVAQLDDIQRVQRSGPNDQNECRVEVHYKGSQSYSSWGSYGKEEASAMVQEFYDAVKVEKAKDPPVRKLDTED